MNEEALFAAALQIPDAGERTAYLDRECAGRLDLRARIDELLKSHDEAGSFLKQPPPECLTTVLKPSDVLGTRIGPYKLLQEIGEGGMGTVFMAEQTEPVKRMVALKVIKPGMDTAQVVARFEAERQALALMDHPNIARVLDAGTTDNGRPYFVMELVKGVAITKYCDEHLLTPRERMELFVPICHAIQHAHQKGIIHRDLKPSNVLIASYDGRPVPKVIDFGVAKAIGQQLTERTMFTGFGGIVGTLEYMSPEQAEFNALDVDTRSDIYSLGVLLYELLTGSTPLTKQQLKQAAITELLRLIREQEPPRPSTRLSESRDTLASLSAQRKLDPARLTKEVSGELDWIVMKALDKDRNRRYETANRLALDVERYLHDEPVEACPPTIGYRLRKVLRRHRRTAIVSSAVLILIMVMLTNHFIGYFRLKEARARATEASNLAQIAAAEAQEDRDRALAAERDAVRQRELEAQAREQATDALARSQFNQANAVRLAGQPGRRWVALDLLKQAEALRSREKATVPDYVGNSDTGSVRHVALPTQSELRTEAVAALMLNDGRVARQWKGFSHAVSPDGRFAVSSSVNASPRTASLSLIDLQTGETVRSWDGKDAESMVGTLMALGPRADQLATVSLSQRQINVWDLKGTKLLRTLAKPTPPADQGYPTRHLSFSPDLRFLAGILPGKPGEVVVAIWPEDGPLEGKTLATVRGVPLVSALFSPESRFLAFASDVKKVTVWNLAENRAEHVIDLPFNTDGALGFDPRGERLAIHCPQVGPASSQLLLWDIAGNRETARFETGGIVSTTPISFAPDGRRVAVGGTNRMIVVAEIPAAGQKEAPLVRLNHGLLPQLVTWSAKDRVLSGGLDGLKQWELASSDAVSLLRLETEKAASGVSRMAFSPDGRSIAAEAWPGPDCALFDSKTGQHIRSLRTGIDVGNVALRFSRDSQQLLRFGQGGLRAWKVEKGEEIRQPGGHRSFATITSLGLRGQSDLVVADAALPGQFKILDVARGKVIWQSQQPKIGTTAIVSSDGRLAVAWQVFAVGRGERPIQVWNLEQDREQFVIPSPPADSFQTMVDVSPDSRWVAAVHFGGDVAKAFPRGTPNERHIQQALTGEGELLTGPTAIGFGQTFASMIHPDQEWVGEVWNAETGKIHCQLYGPINVENYAFSPDGRYLAISMRGGLIRVWDIPAGKELFDWQNPSVSTAPQSIPRQIAFTADSKVLAIPDHASPTLHLLDLTTLNRQLSEVSLGW